MSNYHQTNTRIADHRIIALWTLAETGLGGVLHAFKIPLTGYLVGGMAVLCIGLLASNENTNGARRSQRILSATLVICVLKAMISPHAPPMAYIALGFQGVYGAFIFRIMPLRVISSILFAVPALLESGVQKLLIMTLIYGMNLWKAMDLFGTSILQSWNIEAPASLSHLIISLYLSTFIAAGFICARIMYLLPVVLEKRREKVLLWLKNYTETNQKTRIPRKNKPYFVLTALTIALMAISFWMFGSQLKGFELAIIVLRPIVVILLLLFVFRPMAKYFLHRWLKRSGGQHSQQINQSLRYMEFLKHYSLPLMNSIGAQYKGWKQYPEWLFSLITLALYAPDTDIF